MMNRPLSHNEFLRNLASSPKYVPPPPRPADAKPTHLPVLRTVPVTEVRRHFGEMLRHIERGDLIVVTRRGKPEAIMVSEAFHQSVSQGCQVSAAELLESWQALALERAGN